VRVLVTGGSGFIGQHVVSRLLGRGDEVVVADLNSFPDRDAAITEVLGDLRDPAVVRRAFAPDVDAVIHLAALTSVIKSIENPQDVFDTNVAVTQLLLEQSRLNGVKRLVFASTNAVVGDVGSSTIDESMVIRPLTPYGATKAASEMLLSAYSASYAMVTVALRLTNVYGIGMQVKDSIVARLMRAAMNHGTLQIYGTGEQVRDYVFVSDVVTAFLLGLELDHSDTLVIGSGHSVSVNELHRLACEVTDVEIGYESTPAKKGEMPAVIVDTSKAATIGFSRSYSLSEGLRSTWEDFESSE